MKEIKEEVEQQLGFTISDEEFVKAEIRARKKLESIILQYGDCGGARRRKEYLAELILEDIIANVFSEATIIATANMLNMEKALGICQSAPRD